MKCLYQVAVRMERPGRRKAAVWTFVVLADSESEAKTLAEGERLWCPEERNKHLGTTATPYTSGVVSTGTYLD